jgi:biotin carboxyl carrier protein
MRYYVTLPGGDEIAVDVIQRPGGKLEALVDGEPVEVDAVDVEGATNVRVRGQIFDLWLEGHGATVGFVGSGHRARAQVESDRMRMAASAARSTSTSASMVTAPMPGRVVKVLVAEGAAVQAGAPVIVVEAMKMENELCAAKPGVVVRIHVAVGQNVDGGAALVELAPAEG